MNKPAALLLATAAACAPKHEMTTHWPEADGRGVETIMTAYVEPAPTAVDLSIGKYGQALEAISDPSLDLLFYENPRAALEVPSAL